MMWEEALPWIGVSVVAGACLYWLQGVATKPKLVYQQNDDNERLLERLSLLKQRYWPTFWLANGHVSTAFSSLEVGAPEINFERESVPAKALRSTRHDGVLVLDWAHPKVDSHGCDGTKLEAAPIVVLCHGLTGDSNASYVRTVTKKLTDSGYRVCVLNARGNAVNTLHTPQFHNASNSDDLRVTLHRARARFPEAPLFALGYSLGAAVVGNYVGEQCSLHAQCGVTAAACLAPPVDMVACSKFLHDNWLRRVSYSGHLAKALVRMADHASELFDHSDATLRLTGTRRQESQKSLLAFDRHVTAPNGGFVSAGDYHRQASMARNVPFISVPTLVLCADDDPVCDTRGILEDDFTVSSRAILARTASGGHSMDWRTGWRARDAWSADVVCEFFDAVLEQEGSKPKPLVPLEATQLAWHLRSMRVLDADTDCDTDDDGCSGIVTDRDGRQYRLVPCHADSDANVSENQEATTTAAAVSDENHLEAGATCDVEELTRACSQLSSASDELRQELLASSTVSN